MRIPACLLFVILPLAFSVHAAEPVTDTPGMADARKAGVTVVQLMQQMLTKQSSPDLPGVAAWMKTEGKTLAGLDRKKPDDSWRSLDGDKLYNHSANFWQLYYEVAPGDPGLTMLHAGGLLAAGDATRALMLLRLTLHRNDLDQNTLGIFRSLMEQCDRFPQPSLVLVAEGVKLYDQKEYTSALMRFEAALQLWPLNGWASYEKGLTLGHYENRKAEVKGLFALSRDADPSQWAAWQGDTKEIPGMKAIHTVVRPLWERSAKSLTFVMTEKELEDLANGWQEAEVDDLALAARQVLVVRKGRYLPADQPFISKSLRRLVPGPQAETTLTKLSKGPLTVIRLFDAPVPGKKPEPAPPGETEKKP